MGPNIGWRLSFFFAFDCDLGKAPNSDGVTVGSINLEVGYLGVLGKALFTMDEVAWHPVVL